LLNTKHFKSAAYAILLVSPNGHVYVDKNAFSKIDQILDSVLTILLKQS
jgi:hypothetical protein